MARPIVLDDTSRELQIILDAAVATSELVVYASYVDIDDDNGTPGSQKSETNGTTAVVIVDAPGADVQRVVTEIIVFNEDTATANISILTDDGVDVDTWYYFALPPDKTWNLSDAGALIPMRESEVYQVDEVVNYSTSAQSFEDVDNVKLVLTITTTGGDVLIGFYATIYNSSINARIYFDVEMDASLLAGDDGMFYDQALIAGKQFSVSFVHLERDVEPGMHTFSLQWKVDAGTVYMQSGDGTASRDVHPEFWVKDIG